MNIALKKTPERPIIITIICILGFVLYAIVFVLGLIAFIGLASLFGMGLIWIGLLSLVLTLIFFWPLIGYWNMRKWGPIMFTVLTVISIILELVGGSFLTTWDSIISLIINVIVIVVGFLYYKQMA
ncbi:MAG: hypothetical protein NTV14_02640 [Coprothermobacterota bacterium]|nr:hypothetical protein [Coprothermobacterota bacterium]